MPPNSPKIPDAEIDLIQQVDRGRGARDLGQRGGGQGEAEVRVQARPRRRWASRPARRRCPRTCSTEPFVVSARPSADRRHGRQPLGARWSPSAGTSRSCSTSTTDNHLVGVLPFPEGTIHVLKFSRNGDLLLAGGGRGGQSGLAVVWDVKTGKRVFEIGKEYDAVLAADISPDHGQVALGGPSKIVRVYSTADGQLRLRDEEAHRVDHRRRVQPRRRPARHRRPQQRPGRLGGADRPRVLRPPRPHRGDHRRLLAARLERRRLGERGRHGPALGDGERRQRSRPSAPTAAAPPRSGSPRTAGSSPPAATASSGSGTRTAASSATSRPFGDLALEAVFTHDDAAGHRRRLVGRGPRLGRQGRPAAGEPRRQPRPDRGPARPGSEGPAPRPRPRPTR